MTHDGHNGVSNHQPRHCLLNCLFSRRSKKTSKLRVAGLCAGNSPVAGEFPSQMASNTENVSIWWRHHETFIRIILNWVSPSLSYPWIKPVVRKGMACSWGERGGYFCSEMTSLPLFPLTSKPCPSQVLFPVLTSVTCLQMECHELFRHNVTDARPIAQQYPGLAWVPFHHSRF